MVWAPHTNIQFECKLHQARDQSDFLFTSYFVSRFAAFRSNWFRIDDKWSLNQNRSLRTTNSTKTETKLKQFLSHLRLISCSFYSVDSFVMSDVDWLCYGSMQTKWRHDSVKFFMHELYWRGNCVACEMLLNSIARFKDVDLIIIIMFRWQYTSQSRSRTCSTRYGAIDR